MNMILGFASAYLDFIPSAGSSLSFALISIILYSILSITTLALYLKYKITSQ